MKHFSIFRKSKPAVIITSVLLIALAVGTGLWMRNDYLHTPLFTASSDGKNNVYTSKEITVPKNWAIGWDYDCSKVSAQDARFVIIVSDTHGNPLTDSTVAAVGKKSGQGVMVIPTAGTYTVQVSSAGCTWNAAAKRSSRVAAYEHSTDFPGAQQAVQQPQTLLDLSGNGNQQTKAFTATGKWSATYTYDCSNFGMKGNFQFDVNNTDGSSNTDVGASEIGNSGGATDHYYDGGEHYLTIASECNWHVTIQQD